MQRESLRIGHNMGISSSTLNSWKKGEIENLTTAIARRAREGLRESTAAFKVENAERLGGKLAFPPLSKKSFRPKSVENKEQEALKIQGGPKEERKESRRVKEKA